MWTYRAGARCVLKSRLKRRITLPVRVRSIVTVPFVPHDTVFKVPAREHPGRPLREGVLGPAAREREAERQPGCDGDAEPCQQQSWSSSHALTSLCHKPAAQLSHEIFTGLQPTVQEYGAKFTLDAFRRRRPQLEPHESRARSGRLERRAGRAADSARGVADARPRRRRARATRRAPDRWTGSRTASGRSSGSPRRASASSTAPTRSFSPTTSCSPRASCAGPGCPTRGRR